MQHVSSGDIVWSFLGYNSSNAQVLL